MFGRSLNKYTSNERNPVQIFPWVEKKNKSPSCPQVKQFFSETSVLMCSRVILHHHAWSLVSDDLFWSLKAVLLRKQKDFTFLSHWNFSCLSHLQRNLSTEAKKNEASTHCCFEKQTLKWQWREDKIICGKANSYFRRLSGPFRKNEDISKIVFILIQEFHVVHEIASPLSMFTV